jgi:hypothetical protein
MNLTSYHAKYFAHELTRRSSSDNTEKRASVLSDAQMDTHYKLITCLDRVAFTHSRQTNSK